MPNQPNQNLFTNPAKAKTSKVIYGTWYSAPADMGHNLYGNATDTTVHGVFGVPNMTSGDILISLIGLSAETMEITTSLDGTNYSAAITPVDDETGLDAASSTLGAGRYRLNPLRFGSPRFIKFTKSSTSELAVVVAVVATPIKSH